MIILGFSPESNHQLVADRDGDRYELCSRVECWAQELSRHQLGVPPKIETIGNVFAGCEKMMLSPRFPDFLKSSTTLWGLLCYPRACFLCFFF